MIIHCPKCSYIRLPSDVTPPTECPKCGIVFEKFLATPARSPVTQRKVEPAPAKPAKSVESRATATVTATAIAPASAVTTCPACGGTVAYGAKTCPHCGKAKPAPKPPTKVTRTHLVLAALFVVAMIASQSNRSPELTGEEVAKICAKEAGLDVNSSRAMTVQDLRVIDSCVNRYGYKTKP